MQALKITPIAVIMKEKKLTVISSDKLLIGQTYTLGTNCHPTHNFVSQNLTQEVFKQFTHLGLCISWSQCRRL